MYLLLGAPEDPCCALLKAALDELGRESRIIANPLAYPLRFTWKIEDESSTGQLIWEDGQSLADEEISGVLVRSIGAVDPSGWDPKDLAYLQTEMQAALLAWLWSLDCPVVNRYSAAIWNQPHPPLQYWQPLLWRCGLPALDLLVSNVSGALREFGERFGGVIYAPLSGGGNYAVATEAEWDGLMKMQSYTPLNLVQPHGFPILVCVSGEQVIWEPLPANAEQVENSIRNFAALVGLSFVELILDSTETGLRVVTVEAFPRLEHFGKAAQQSIIAGLVRALTSGAKSC